jgi:hypothetical protein
MKSEMEEEERFRPTAGRVHTLYSLNIVMNGLYPPTFEIERLKETLEHFKPNDNETPPQTLSRLIKESFRFESLGGRWEEGKTVEKFKSVIDIDTALKLKDAVTINALRTILKDMESDVKVYYSRKNNGRDCELPKHIPMTFFPNTTTGQSVARLNNVNKTPKPQNPKTPKPR